MLKPSILGLLAMGLGFVSLVLGLYIMFGLDKVAPSIIPIICGFFALIMGSIIRRQR